MKKYLIGVLLLLLLAACGPSATPPDDTESATDVSNGLASESTEAEEEAASAEEPVEEETAVAEEESVAEEEIDADTSMPAVDSPTYEPATTILEASILKATDHTKGAEEPIIAIIEYGDFQ